MTRVTRKHERTNRYSIAVRTSPDGEWHAAARIRTTPTGAERFGSRLLDDMRTNLPLAQVRVAGKLVEGKK